MPTGTHTTDGRLCSAAMSDPMARRTTCTRAISNPSGVPISTAMA